MSLTKDAIEKLVETGNAPLFVEQVKQADTQSQLITLPTGYDIKDLEGFQEFRNSLRGRFDTSVIAEFMRYVSDHEQEGSKIFIDQDEMTAKAIFDIGTEEKPGHQRHTANLSIKKTAPFKKLLRIDGERMSQRQMAEMLEDYSDYFTAFSSDGQLIDMTKAVAAIRDLNFEVVRGSDRAVQDFSQQQSEYERMATKTKDDLIIPAAFVFSCVPYNGLQERRFELRLSITGNEVLVLRIKRLEEEQEKIAFEFLEIIEDQQKELNLNITTYIGDF